MLPDDAGVYDDYKLTDNTLPLYIVIDRDMNIEYRGTGSVGHSLAVSALSGLL